MTQQEKDISMLKTALGGGFLQEAFNRILDRALPELPEDYNYLQVGFHDGCFEGYVSGVMNSPAAFGVGPTPRAAVLAALSKIGEAK